MNKLWQENDIELQKGDDVVYKLLKSRGIENPEEFLRITKKKFHNPYKMKDMKKAVQRILQAIKNNERIGIYGDYDADGVSSTSIWVLFLKEVGADVIYFIPDRFIDGYGLGERGEQYMIDNDVKLVITCDTGITGIINIHRLIKEGIDVIVTDHHEPQRAENFSQEEQKVGKRIGNYLIPNCTAVVNIKRPDCKYPFKSLAGVGVSFKVLCAIAEKIHPAKRAGAYQYMDLVALGTFADQMDIVDENRVIGSYGLRMMSTTKNRGLYQLIRANELNNKQLTSQDVGWVLAPCINAAGRIVSAEQAVEMIISDNKLDAYRYAKTLVAINKERKELTKQYVHTIIKAIEAEQQEYPTNIIVFYYPNIPEGIVGLLAGRLMNHFYKPIILLTDSEEEGIIKGSSRSIPEFNMFETLLNYTDLLDGFGGHHMACGLSLKKENLNDFKASLIMYADAVLTERDLQPKIYIDSIVKPEIIDIEFVKDLKRLEPYGNGNQRPIFMMRNMKVIKEKPVGEEKNHFWGVLSDGKHSFSTIGFFLYEKYEAIKKPKMIDIAFYPEINEYPKGTFNVQLKIQDLREAR